MAKAPAGPYGTPGVTGSIGATTFAQGMQGQTILKQKPIPTNPQSASQTGNRGMFGFIAAQWDGLDAADQESYDDAAAANSILPFAQYAKDNNRRWQQAKAPSKNRVAAEENTPAVPTIAIAAGAEGAPNTVTVTVTGTEDDWGCVVYYKAAGAPTGLRAEAIAVRAVAVGEQDLVVEHDGDAEGYYGVRVFTGDGVIGAIVTDQAA